MNIIAISPKSGMEQAEIIDTFWTYQHDSPIIFLNSSNYTISEKFALIKDYIVGLPFTVTHDVFDEYNMHVLICGDNGISCDSLDVCFGVPE